MSKTKSYWELLELVKLLQWHTLLEHLNQQLFWHQIRPWKQLYGEFKGFFPDNAVEYFVSYYDYYQPEAYAEIGYL